MNGMVPKRLGWRLSILLGLWLLTAAAALPSAQPAVSATDCRGTLTLEQVYFVSDTDPNPPWTKIDAWTYHISAFLNDAHGNLLELEGLQGDTGHLEPVNTAIIDSAVVGSAGDQVRLRIHFWSKERDPKSGTRGVYPRDRGQRGFQRTETCVPSAFRFSVLVDVLAEPAPPGPDEHDGQLEFRFNWMLDS